MFVRQTRSTHSFDAHHPDPSPPTPPTSIVFHRLHMLTFSSHFSAPGCKPGSPPLRCGKPRSCPWYEAPFPPSYHLSFLLVKILIVQTRQPSKARLIFRNTPPQTSPFLQCVTKQTKKKMIQKSQVIKNSHRKIKFQESYKFNFYF